MTTTTANVYTGSDVSIFRLLSIKGMLKMEKIGMKTRGGALRPRIAAEFGLTARTPHDTFIKVIEDMLATLKA